VNSDITNFTYESRTTFESWVRSERDTTLILGSFITNATITARNHTLPPLSLSVCPEQTSYPEYGNSHLWDGSLFFSSANLEVDVEDCTLMGCDAVLIGNLFLYFGRACCHHLHGMRRSMLLRFIHSIPNLRATRKTCGGFVPWKIVVLFLLRSCFFANNFYFTVFICHWSGWQWHA